MIQKKLKDKVWAIGLVNPRCPECGNQNHIESYGRSTNDIIDWMVRLTVCVCGCVLIKPELNNEE